VKGYVVGPGHTSSVEVVWALQTPTLGNHGSGVKLYNFCRNLKPVITAELSVMSGLDPSWLAVTWLYLGIIITLINSYVTKVGHSLKVVSLVK
jgi:hypothetical protein